MRAAWCLGVCMIGLVAGCRGRPGSASASSATPNASAAPSAVAQPSAKPPATTLPSSLQPAEEAGDAGHAAPSGGNWLKCYANFQPRTRPDLDVLRLGLMCGPSNGMRKEAEGKAAELSPEAGEREHRFQAKAGECFRVFAVGAPGIEDLDVEVLDPKGKRVAFDTSDDRWPVVKPDGPFCVFDDGEYRARVRVQRGSGGYAIEIWRLH